MSSERLSRAALAVLHGTGIVLFIGMVLLVLAQVIARKFFEPLVWSEELARYTFIWIAFIGWVIANQRKSHIRISLVADRAGPKLKLALGVFADLCVIVFALIFVVKGWKLVSNNLDIETVTLFFDFWLVYTIIPVSALATIVVMCFDMLERVHGHATDKEIVL